MVTGPELLEGQRVLVVGASSGIGRALGAAAIASGARVVVAARRRGALDELVADNGGGTAVAADITDPESCMSLAGRCREVLGGLDVVIAATGVSALARVEETDADLWNRLLGTNVVGINQLLSAVVPLLGRNGIAAVLSSEDAARARSGLAAYAASKAALERSMECWRLEHAPLRFPVLAIGATVPTEASASFDQSLLEDMLGRWVRSGHIQNDAMTPEGVAASVLGILGAVLPFPEVGLDHATMKPAGGIFGDPTSPFLEGVTFAARDMLDGDNR